MAGPARPGAAMRRDAASRVAPGRAVSFQAWVESPDDHEPIANSHGFVDNAQTFYENPIAVNSRIKLLKIIIHIQEAHRRAASPPEALRQRVNGKFRKNFRDFNSQLFIAFLSMND
ncbi:hypothetical protein [Burkholderia metallica]|uniref:hypothetical protein n=1 Tax=Burkholderia metallica TaxID=488729 RepID=UPI00158A6DE3|nr:hypothetical protein [Burkholderia metallica]MCA7999730.1 hypothetical protein [Burkholderia metallica]